MTSNDTSPPSSTLSGHKGELDPLLASGDAKWAPSPYVYPFIFACMSSTIGILFHVGSTKHEFSTLSAGSIYSAIQLTLAILALSLLRPELPHRKEIPLLVTRALIGAIAMLLDYEALRRIPLGTAEVIFATTPALTSFLCVVFLREALKRVELLALVASFFGIALVSHSSHPAKHLYGPPLIGALCSILAAMCESVSCTIVRALGTRVHPLHIIFSRILGVLFWCSVLARKKDYEAVITNVTGTALISVAAVVGFLASAAYITGLQQCRAGPALLIGTANIPISYMLGLLVLGEKCGWSGLLGALLVAGAAIAVGASSTVPRKKDCTRDCLDTVPPAQCQQEGV